MLVESPQFRTLSIETPLVSAEFVHLPYVHSRITVMHIFWGVLLKRTFSGQHQE
jgi:hypothetical protein